MSAAGGTGANTYSTFNDHASVCVLTCEYVRRRCVSRREPPVVYEKPFYETNKALTLCHACSAPPAAVQVIASSAAPHASVAILTCACKVKPPLEPVLSHIVVMRTRRRLLVLIP